MGVFGGGMGVEVTVKSGLNLRFWVSSCEGVIDFDMVYAGIVIYVVFGVYQGLRYCLIWRHD